MIDLTSFFNTLAGGARCNWGQRTQPLPLIYPLTKQSHNSIGTLTPFGLTSKLLQVLKICSRH